MEERKGEHPLGDAGQLIFAAVFLLVWLADSFFLRRTTFLAELIPLPIRLVVLAATWLVAILLTRSAHIVVAQEHRPGYVVTTGAFHYIRHPLYLASLLAYLGLTFSTASLISLVLWVVIFIFHNYIGSYEERLLVTKFGDMYRQYQSKTGKWIPRLDAWR